MWWTWSETAEKWKQRKNTKWAEKDNIGTGRQKHEQIEEEVKEGKIDEVASYMYIVTYTGIR